LADSEKKSKHALSVAIITMSFPYDRETFAINEFLYLKDYCELEVHSLRPKHKIAEQLVEDYDLNDIKMSHYSWRTLWLFLFNIFKYPSAFLHLLVGIFRIKHGKISYLLKSLILIPRVMEFFVMFKKNPPDIIHAYWCHFPMLIGLLGKKYFKRTKFTVNYIAHDIYLRYNIAGYLKDNFEVHFSICEDNIPYMKSLGVKEKDIQVIYHGVPEKYLDYPLSKKQKFTILSVGSMIPRKSFDLVLDVFKALKKDYPDACLIIGGDGPEKVYLLNKKESLGLSNIRFTGYLMHDEVMELMNTSEIFLLMSKNERIANVAKEAMLMTCYCISTKTPGVEELIIDRENGFLIDVDDVNGAVKTIDSIWKHKEEFEHIRLNARNTIREKFILEKKMQQYIKTWESITK